MQSDIYIVAANKILYNRKLEGLAHVIWDNKLHIEMYMYTKTITFDIPIKNAYIYCVYTPTYCKQF